MKTLPITIGELIFFRELFRRSGQEQLGIRFGQAWINEYLPANLADPELFYEPDEGKAFSIIVQKYGEFQYLDNPNAF